MSQAQDVTLQMYLDFAFQRNGDSASLEDLADNFRSVQNALLNISADPNWPHFREETRITTEQPMTGYVIVLTDGSTAITRDPAQITVPGDDWLTLAVDATWVLKVSGEDTEYPIASVTNSTQLVLKYPYVDKGLVADLDHAACTLIKRFYAMPDNFRELIAIKRATASIDHVLPLSPESLEEHAQTGDDGGMPQYYALFSRPASTQKVVRFLPYPEGDYAFQYDVKYLRWPTEVVLASPSVAVDWPPELRSVLECAIEIEIARKNRDPMAEDAAVKALARVMPKFEAGSLEDGGNQRLMPFGINEDLDLDRITIDSTNA